MHSMKKTAQAGFTLIELLVVVATLSILAVIAIPTYLDYVARAQVSTGIASISAMQDAMADYYQTTGIAPAGRTDVGYSATASDGASQYVDEIQLVDGSIIISYGNSAANPLVGTEVVYSMAVNGDGVVSFVCQNATFNRALPPGLNYLGTPSIGTDVPNKFLPIDCRT